MPRITPLRVLLFVPAFYLLLIALWAILPFPDVPWGTDTVGKTEDRLNKGGTITRVYKYVKHKRIGMQLISDSSVGDFFSYYDQTPLSRGSTIFPSPLVRSGFCLQRIHGSIDPPRLSFLSYLRSPCPDILHFGCKQWKYIFVHVGTDHYTSKSR